MTLIVTEYEPGRRLSWSTVVDSDETGSSACHGWVITPTADGCHVLSEETQQGPFFLEEIGHKHPGALYRHDGLRISNAPAESEMNHPIYQRMETRQPIRWSANGAHLLLQVRCAVLDYRLETLFREWSLASGQPRRSRLPEQLRTINGPISFHVLTGT
jgi:hypothetical protein